MIKRLFTSKYIPIIVTEPAWSKLNSISNKLSINKFIFSATSGGCNGYNYNLTTINNRNYNTIITTSKFKPTIINDNNNIIIIDPVSEFLLLGTTIDYIEEDFENNIYENKFVFIPDKKTNSSCGCGISFTPI
tara:strand:- start:25 stop:423 length:399 start_codon:yes stop_codon:yes gene_type:complete